MSLNMQKSSIKIILGMNQIKLGSHILKDQIKCRGKMENDISISISLLLYIIRRRRSDPLKETI